MTVLFDANVVLDWLLQRNPFFQDSASALRETIRLGHTPMLPASLVNDIHYVIRKALKSEPLARQKTELLFSLFSFAKVDDAVLNQALRLQGQDFEDDIVAATALRCGADCIVTNDSKDFSGYGSLIPVYSASGFLDALLKR